MKPVLSTLAVITACVVLSVSTSPRAESLEPVWDSGLSLQNEDGTIRVNVGGHIHNDWAVFPTQDEEIENAVGDFEDGTEIRSARLYVAGRLYGNLDFKVQYDFASGQAAAKTVFVGLAGIPYVGSIRAGHFQEPFSLDWITSTNSIPFMERSHIQTFVPGWNTGLLAGNSILNRRATWHVGLFRDTDSAGAGSGDGKYSVTARATGLLWKTDQGSVIHLGLGYSHRRPASGTVSYSAMPGSHLGNQILGTGNLAADKVNLVAPELLFIGGSFSLQGEAAFSSTDGMSDPLYGFYALMSYFLTGETRPYKTSSGAPGSVRPARNFGDGIGAWEVLARYAYIDLNGSDVNAGTAATAELGLTWYLNPNARVMGTFGITDIDVQNYSGLSSVVQMRFQAHM